ncbi:MAG TPA: SgcJ/EcaC family oxidoreductase [Isosphaeraceae bacterium]
MKTIWLGFGSAMGVALFAWGHSEGNDPASVRGARARQGVQAENQADPAASAETKAVREVVEAFVKAYNARDAKAIAEQFAEDGQIVEPGGSVTEGRGAIEKRYREAFEADPEARIEVKSESIRLLSPDVAQEQGRATIRSGDAATKSGRYQALYVRRGGHWLQSSVYDFPEEPQKLTPADRLKDLEWLLGEWIDEGDGAVARATCHWDASKVFLIRDFELKIGGRDALSGTQRIGWDPTTGQFRSWVFDSEGGFSEGRWTRDGDRWVIKNEGFVPDGRVVTATNLITRAGKDRVRWSTTDRTLGGDALEDDAEVILVRKPPKPM